MTIEAGDAHPRYMSNVRLFSSKLEDTKSGGLLIRDVLTLGEGKWHASNWDWPVYYSGEELEKATVSDRSLWDGHQNKSPTGKVGHFLNHHYDPAQKGVVADVFLHGHSQKSRDLIEMVKAGTRGEIDPMWVSVEHTSNDFYNKALDQYEARDIDIMGLAIVDSGACRTCKLNEKTNTNHSKGMDLELKESEAAYTKQGGEIESLRKELADAKAVKAATPADVEVVRNENKALADALKAIESRLQKIESAPAPAKTPVIAGSDDELVII